MGAAEPKGAREIEGALARSRSCPIRYRSERNQEIFIPVAIVRDSVIEFKGVSKGYERCSSRTLLQRAAGAIVAHRPPTGGKSDAVCMITARKSRQGQDRHRADVKMAHVTSRAKRSRPTDRLGIHLGRRGHPHRGKFEMPRVPTSPFNIKARPAEEAGTLSGGERAGHLAKTMLAEATCCCWTSRPTTWTWNAAALETRC